MDREDFLKYIEIGRNFQDCSVQDNFCFIFRTSYAIYVTAVFFTPTFNKKPLNGGFIENFYQDGLNNTVSSYAKKNGKNIQSKSLTKWIENKATNLSDHDLQDHDDYDESSSLENNLGDDLFEDCVCDSRRYLSPERFILKIKKYSLDHKKVAQNYINIIQNGYPYTDYVKNYEYTSRLESTSYLDVLQINNINEFNLVTKEDTEDKEYKTLDLCIVLFDSENNLRYVTPIYFFILKQEYSSFEEASQKLTEEINETNKKKIKQQPHLFETNFNNQLELLDEECQLQKFDIKELSLKANNINNQIAWNNLHQQCSENKNIESDEPSSSEGVDLNKDKPIGFVHKTICKNKTSGFNYQK